MAHLHASSLVNRLNDPNTPDKPHVLDEISAFQTGSNLMLGAGNELFGLREYRPGDSLRRIHWPSSARRGEIVVREYEPPGKTTLALLLDPAPPTADHADQVARIAASEAWDCIREGGLVSLWSPGLEATPPSGDLWGVLEWLARYPYATPGPASRPPRSGEEVVVITASANADVMQTAEASRQSRGWIVGEVDVTADVPLERVGTRWPL